MASGRSLEKNLNTTGNGDSFRLFWQMMDATDQEYMDALKESKPEDVVAAIREACGK